jgi:RNA polymerase sigma-70 factor, ECF subfamily
MCNDNMLSEDIMQNVFIKLFQNLDLIKNDKSVHFWLFKAARNEYYSLLRNTKIKRLYTEAEEICEVDIEDKDSLSKDYENKELKTLIWDELEKVNPVNKEIFILKEYSGFSYKEIASVMELDIETVKSRLYKLRQKLISKMSKIV